MRRGLRILREAFEAHPAPSLVISPAGTLLLLNAAAEELLGVSSARVRARPLAELPRGGAAMAELALRAIRERATARGELELGPLGRVVATAVPLLAPRAVRGAVLRVRRPEERLDLETLAAGLAHEIKNPLAGMKGAADLLRDELPEGSPLRAYPELIAREATRVDGLVRSLLDLTRPLTVELRPENVHAIADDVLLLARAWLGPGAAVERRYDPSLPELEVDREAVTQVLVNLVKNAAEAMAGREGTIAIETGVEPGMRVRVRGRTRQLLRVAVIDEGPGLAEGVELFTPFATTKPKGTGLGLVLSRRIAEAHGGRLDVRERRGGGGVESVLLLPL